MMRLSYKKSGVDYGLLDPVKRLGQAIGLSTSDNLKTTGFRELTESRGETAYIIEAEDAYYAFVEEGLGTKNLVADEMEKITGRSYYEVIGYDTVIAITMDLVSVGARPLVVLSYWAVGDSSWFADKVRLNSFVTGWKKACCDVRAVWGGGETPTLKNIIYPNKIDLAGAAFGIIKPKERLTLGSKIQEGDVIILFESSGIHVNGLTLARKVAQKLPAGFAAKLTDGKLFGEELLIPTLNYSKLVEELFKNGIKIHYMINITGHGWRKLMRAKKSLTYLIDKPPPVPEVFQFIKRNTKLSNREMYATFNMGAGFALILDRHFIDRVLSIAAKCRIKAWVGGRVEKGMRQVIISPNNIVYKAHDLEI
ncbi:phosphoribosylformylglycinamidine cyclo-ligase [Candidatus Gottesmanbacteria bacterium]|nr:phosphoribosylformylglycinamidine cyclo-ligase [Candidatus Gottesmanbacteria bacterium]